MPEPSNIENNITKSLSIYPNPASDIVKVNSEENINYIEILNISGQIVSFENVNTNNAEINISNLSSGVYFIKVYTANDVTTQKLIVE